MCKRESVCMSVCLDTCVLSIKIIMCLHIFVHMLTCACE